MARWMINCKEHSRLASRSMEYPLSFWERLSVRIHQWICPSCNQLRKQFDAIRKACRLVAEESIQDQETPEDDTIGISEDACQKIKAALKKHLE